MQVFVNEREVANLSAGRATVGELVEALGVHVDPSEIVTAVALDDEQFSAGEDERYARRAAAGVARLTLTTTSIPALAARLHAEVYEALRSVVGTLEQASAGLDRGDVVAANALLARAFEELRLVLILDRQTAALGGHEAVTAEEELTPLADELLAAQRHADRAATRRLLAEQLVPMLRRWSAGKATTPSADEKMS